MKRDPIALLRMHMRERDEITDDEVQALDAELKAVVQDALDFADASPEPPAEHLYTDVLVETTSDDYVRPGAEAAVAAD